MFHLLDLRSYKLEIGPIQYQIWEDEHGMCSGLIH